MLAMQRRADMPMPPFGDQHYLIMEYKRGSSITFSSSSGTKARQDVEKAADSGETRRLLIFKTAAKWDTGDDILIYHAE